MSYKQLLSQFPNIQTERLVLREIEYNDAENIYSFFSDHYTMQYYGLDAHKALDETMTSIKQFRKGFRGMWLVKWGIALPESNIIIGLCGYHNWSKANYRAEIGYILRPDFWGKGIMYEALLPILEFGLKDMRLNRIEAKVHIDNIRSEKLLASLDFQKEGMVKQYKYANGKFDDYYIYSYINALRIN